MTTEIISAGNTILVDDFCNKRINDGLTECSAVITRALLASGRGTAQLGPGTYLIDPTALVTVGAAQTLRGAGMGATKIKLQSGKTGIGVRLSSSSTLADLTIEGNDESNTTGAACVSGGAANNITCFRVRFKDLATGAGDNGAMSGVQFICCESDSNTTGYQCSSGGSALSWFGGKISNCTTGILLQSSPEGGLIHGVTFDTLTTGINSTSARRLSIAGNRFNSVTTPINLSGLRNEIGNNYSSAGTLDGPSLVNNLQNTYLGDFYWTAAPSSGTWLQGERVKNRNPGTSGSTAVEWVCSTAGTPGTWQDIYRGPRTFTATWDPGSLASGASASTSITGLSGLVVGQTALATHSQDLPDGFILFAQVKSSTAIDVSLCNIGGSTTDVASGTLTVHVFQ